MNLHLLTYLRRLVMWCRSWVMFHWKCWRQCWCRRSWCCMSSLESPGALNAERISRWHQYVGTGVWHWLVGSSHQPGSGSDTRSSSSL